MFYVLYPILIICFFLLDRVGGDLSTQLGEEYKAVVEQNACITLQISKCTTIGPLVLESLSKVPPNRSEVG